MLQCWDLQPDNRPTFGDIINWLETILQSSAEYLELSHQDTVNNATYLIPNPSFGKFWRFSDFSAIDSSARIFRP